MNYKNGFTNIIIAVVVVVVLAGAGYYVITKNLAGDEPTSKVIIDSISPTSGAVGTNITIRGSGFHVSENDITFLNVQYGPPGQNNAYLNSIPSPDGKSLAFALIDTLSPCTSSQLKLNRVEACPDLGMLLPEGAVEIAVVNESGTSNSVAFEVVLEAVAELRALEEKALKTLAENWDAVKTLIPYEPRTHFQDGQKVRGGWLLPFEIQFIGNGYIFIKLDEDQSDTHIALLNFKDNQFTLIKFYKSKLEFSFAEWRALIESYGNPAYEVSNYGQNIEATEGEAEAVWPLRMVSKNLFVK